MTETFFAGNNPLKYSDAPATGQFVKLDDDDFYMIDNVQNMDPFFISVVSSSDHWMFISSNGALTAGRKKPEIALFPYYTVDKIHDSADITGAKTVILARRPGARSLWEPFSARLDGVYTVTRRLYKNIAGNKIVFEERNHDLEITFSYMWTNSERFGLVRRSTLVNDAAEELQVDLLDGIQNILPFGVDRSMQADKSCLVDAYKKCELVPATGLGLYMLSSIPVDRAEPSESLKANTVWSFGADIQSRLLSSVQLDKFRRGRPVSNETEVRGKRGAYFVNMAASLAGGAAKTWYLVAEVNQTSAKVAELNRFLRSASDVSREIEADIEVGTRALVRIVASADGLQLTSDRLSVSRHFANVLFNVMRGGIFDGGYLVSPADLSDFARKANLNVFEKHRNWLDHLPDPIHYTELLEQARKIDDAGLIRLCLEYMPLTFGRRHGDPSRPWNLFAIETRNEDGSKILNYQGNWRDIFQNWEALALSFPGYVESMISKFVNASTPDGYNPYRVTRDGFEWEVHNPADPWSFIGYWGDHQVIYLVKLLELAEKYHPGRLLEFLQEEIFSYANVPYRIKDYQSVLQDPFHSIDYDEELDGVIAGRVRQHGADGKLVRTAAGEPYFVNLAEKLLASILSKLSNFVPEGGIWMNTQRPEWNDANNALAGYGLSMVTLYYLRRYIEFCRRLFTRLAVTGVRLSEELVEFLSAIYAVLEEYRPLLAGGFNDKSRRRVLDGLGLAGSCYRSRVYQTGFSEKKTLVTIEELLRFFSLALDFIDQSIRANRRADGLYHAYNLLSVKGEDEIAVSRLCEMLEGQVAVLSSGHLTAGESVEVLEALRKSALFREDQYSYILYPDRRLPEFLTKNNIPAESIRKLRLLQRLAADGNKALAEKDVDGVFHFNAAFTNKNVLIAALSELEQSGYQELVKNERRLILDIYEEMFDHKSFTGRSGSFFSYEGLGSIYWHMVSKLLLAVKDLAETAASRGESPETARKLRGIYFDVRAGLGTDKSPSEYGAFPTDPYSHTPSHAGAQQPGMTGQVKEDILARLAEMGLVVAAGRIRFQPFLIREQEFLQERAKFKHFDVVGTEKELALSPGEMAYTCCQVPVVLRKGAHDRVRLLTRAGTREIEGLEIGQADSQAVFERTGQIQAIEVELAL